VNKGSSDMTMIERVAKAIEDVRCESFGEPIPAIINKMARAAIEAMREPTQQMLDASYGLAGSERGDGRAEASVWSAMIDAALATPAARASPDYGPDVLGIPKGEE